MRTARQLQALAAAILLLFAVAVPSNAYVLEGPRWFGSNVVFRLGLGSPGGILIDGNTSWDTAAAPALGMWNQNIQQTQLSYVLGSSSAASGDGLNSVIFSTTVFGQSFGSNTLAVTYYRYSGSQMTEADILFNQNKTFDSYRGPLRFGPGGSAIGDIRRILLHELGHALGLGHPDQNGQQVEAIMNSMTSNRETLSYDDIAGGQSLYGAPSSSPSPSPSVTPTPTPAPTAPPTPTPVPPTLSISASPVRVATGSSATFTIFLSAPSSNPITVNYSMSGSAILGVNYTLSGSYGQVIVPAGSTSGQVVLTVTTPPIRAKKAKMTLRPGFGYKLRRPKAVTVTISP